MLFKYKKCIYLTNQYLDYNGLVTNFYNIVDDNDGNCPIKINHIATIKASDKVNIYNIIKKNLDGGGYVEKYMKYKNKYIQMKNHLKKNNK